MSPRSRAALSLLAAVAPLAGCTLLVSLDGLSGGATTASPDATTDSASDAAASDAPATQGETGPPLPYRDTVLADAPLAYLRFAEPSGTIAHDETDNHNDVTLNGTVIWGVPGALGSDTNTAIRFDGQTSGGTFQNASIDFSGTAPYSLEAWILATTADGIFRRIYSKDADPTGGREELGIYVHMSSMSFERYVAGAALAVQVAPIVSRYVHIVGTYDGAKMLFYVDGVAVGGQVKDRRAQAAKSVPFMIGCEGTSNAVFDGALDEMAIYDHALTAERVKAHFDAAKR